MTSFLVNPTEGYRTFSRFDSLRCWPSISMVESVKVISAPPFCLKLVRAQNVGRKIQGSSRLEPWIPWPPGLTTSLSPTYFQTSALLVRPNYVLCRYIRSAAGGPMKYLKLKIAIFLVTFSALALAQDEASFAKRVTVKKLANGLTLVICERPEAPVFSFFTLVDAGSAQDPMLATGLAHMFEHMAFKGTTTIGTTDYAAEKAALAKVETAYAAYITERDKTVGQDTAKLKELEKTWKDDIAAA